MASIVINHTTRQKTLNLPGGNSVTLMPLGTIDAKGQADRATLLEGEELADDVVNARLAGDITIEQLPPAEQQAAAPESAQPVQKRPRSRTSAA